MPNKRILYIITKLELGGAQTQLLSLIRGLDRNKFTPYLFTASTGMLIVDARQIENLSLHLSANLERPVNPLKDFLAFLEARRYIRKNKIDIVHTHSSKAGIIGRLAARSSGVRVILHTVHGWSFNDFQSSLLRKFYIYLEKVCARFTTKLVVVCQADKVKGLKSGIGQQGQYEVINYGIDHARFSCATAALSKNQEVLIGMIACFKPQKAPLDFIEAARQVVAQGSNARFILVGDGILRNAIQKRILAYGLEDKITLAGWRRDIPEILNSLDVFVLTSLWEGLPVSVLEALACGKPVVATNTGGIAEAVLDGKNGFLVEPKEAKRLAGILSRLAGDQQLRIKLGKQAKENIAGAFLLDSMIENHQMLYSKLAG